MRARKKVTKSMLMFRRIICGILAFSLFILMYFELTVKDRIELAIIAQVKSISSTALNDVVGEYIKSNKNLCDNLILIKSDSSGNIKSISENIFYVNSLKSDLNKLSQKAIDDVMRTYGINVQLGNFTGFTILSEFGPYVHMDIDATTNISCEIISSFESAGLNQTLHHITLQLTVDMYVGNPIRIESIDYTNSYEISQTIIVGKVPSNFFQYQDIEKSNGKFTIKPQYNVKSY